VKFTTVPDDANFYKEHMDIILGAESKFEQVVREQVLSGRKKHIAFLERRSMPPVILAQEIKEFSVIVHGYADALDREYGIIPISESQQSAPSAAASSVDAFPRKEAIERFERDLSKLIDEDKSRTVQQRARAAQEQQQARADDVKAQAFTLAGAHNDKTIAAVAERSATKVIKPIQAQVTDLKRRIASAPHSAAAAAASAPRSERKRKAATDVAPDSFPSRSRVDQSRVGPSIRRQNAAASSVSHSSPSRTVTSFEFDPIVFAQNHIHVATDTLMEDVEHQSFPSSGGGPLNTQGLHQYVRRRQPIVTLRHMTSGQRHTPIRVEDDHDDDEDTPQ